MNVKQEPEWRKCFVLRAYVHKSKLKNVAIRMVFQYWVTNIFMATRLLDYTTDTTYVFQCKPVTTSNHL